MLANVLKYIRECVNKSRSDINDTRDGRTDEKIDSMEKKSRSFFLFGCFIADDILLFMMDKK